MNDKIERAIDETRAFLDERPAPDVRRAVMRRIENLEPFAAPPRVTRLNRFAQALWAPRAVTIRPAFALAAAAAIVALVLVPYQFQPTNVPIASGDPHVFVQFHLETTASRVQLAGSFTNWEPRYDLRQSAPGVWTITVPLTQGVHDYSFVVDGRQWVPDPHAPQIGDGFGGINSRLALLYSDTPAL